MIMPKKNTATIEYGDYQTPRQFAHSVCAKLKDIYSISPTVVFEPTFGTGNFIKSALSVFESIKIVYGVELNKEYYATTQQYFLQKKYI